MVFGHSWRISIFRILFRHGYMLIDALRVFFFNLLRQLVIICGPAEKKRSIKMVKAVVIIKGTLECIVLSILPIFRALYHRQIYPSTFLNTTINHKDPNIWRLLHSKVTNNSITYWKKKMFLLIMPFFAPNRKSGRWCSPVGIPVSWFYVQIIKLFFLPLQNWLQTRISYR